MRIRKIASACFLMLCLTLLSVLPVHAASSVAVKTISGRNYLYYKSTGENVTGPVGIREVPEGSGRYYCFFATNGRIYAGRVFKRDGKYYYAAKNGVLKKGWRTVGEKRYYFNKSTFAASTGWNKIGSKYYYFKRNGVLVTGWLHGAKNTYYLDPEKKGAKTIGWKTVGKKAYYFNAKGYLQTGLLSIGGKYYYLDPQAGGARKTGWITVNGNKYYMSKKADRVGQAVIGWMKRDGAFYYFNSSGIMQTGWLTIGEYKYYLDPSTGKRATGQRIIGGKTYTFNTNGVLQITGPWSIKVNKGTGVVTVYRGEFPVKAMLCSVGNPTSLTPSGTFYIGIKHRWWELFGGVYGQYTSQITGNILFHSVFYRVNGNNHTLYTNEYNKLGSPASHGCVRLNVASAKYIYDNCPSGTPVTIFYGTSADDPLGKPAHVWASGSYDPTDPNL